MNSTDDHYSNLEIELVNYVFAKILLTWGKRKFTEQFGNAREVSECKRDWHDDLLNALRVKQGPNESVGAFQHRAKGKVDRIFCEIREQANRSGREWDWPCLRKICSFMVNEYKPRPKDKPPEIQQLPRPENLKRSREIGQHVISDLVDKLRVNHE